MLIKLQLVNTEQYPSCHNWSKRHDNKPVYLYIYECAWFDKNDYHDPEVKVYTFFDPANPNWGVWAKRKDLRVDDFIISTEMIRI